MENTAIWNRVYTDLDPDKPSFRLFSLLPPLASTGQLLTVLKPVSFDDDPPSKYNAVSYVWGDPTLEATVFCNGFDNQLPVTSALVSVLHHLRDKHLQDVEYDVYIRLWIDGICINQRNSAEKARQIRMMGDIYACAESTIVWLGEASEDSGFAFDFLKKMSSFVSEAGSSGFPSPRGTPQYGSTNQTPRQQADSSDSIALDCGALRLKIPELFELAAWKAIDELFRRPFWSRLWVYQEILLSQNAILLCGDRDLPWGDAKSAYSLLNQIEWTKPWLHFEPELIRMMRSNHYCLAEPFLDRAVTPKPLLYLLIKTLHLRCVDPRDKIYGVLGLCGAEEAAAVQIDYEQPVAHLYTSILRERMKKRCDAYTLATLLLAGSGLFIQDSRSCSDLPTWVVDWAAWTAQADQNHPLLTPILWWQRLCYSASRKTDPTVRIDSSLPHLFTQAVLLEVVDDVEYISVPLTPAEFWEELLEWDLDDAEDTYPTGISWLEAGIRTFLADNDRGPMKRLGLDQEVARTIVVGFFEYFEQIGQERLDEPRPDNALSRWLGRPDLDEGPREKRKKLVLFGEELENLEKEVREMDGRIARDTFEDHAAVQIRGHCFIRTEEEYMGLAPFRAQKGDQVCVVPGLSVPLLLRAHDAYYELVGPCFLLGYMDGEALALVEGGKVSFEEICIH